MKYKDKKPRWMLQYCLALSKGALSAPPRVDYNRSGVSTPTPVTSTKIAVVGAADWRRLTAKPSIEPTPQKKKEKEKKKKQQQSRSVANAPRPPQPISYARVVSPTQLPPPHIGALLPRLSLTPSPASTKESGPARPTGRSSSLSLQRSPSPRLFSPAPSTKTRLSYAEAVAATPHR